MKKIIFPVISLVLWGLSSALLADPTAQEILAAADNIRNPKKSFRLTVTLTEYNSGKQVDTSTLVTYARPQHSGGQYATLNRFVAPERDVGKLMLKNGNDLWFYDPSAGASVRLSPQQRLMGQASNGDVVTVNFAKDYQASLLGEEETVNGEKQKRSAYKLSLVATAPDVTYHAIEMWIDTENSRPIKARFYAPSGRLLKTAFYRRFQPQLEETRPTETVIIDGVDPKSVTILRYSDYVWKDVSENWLHRDNLPRFQPE